MDPSENELLAALTDLLSLSVLFDKLLVVHHSVTIVLCEVAKEVVKEEVEGLQEVSMILNADLNVTLGHSLLDRFTISVLHELVDFEEE